MTAAEIQKYLEAHPEKRHRKCIPEIVEALTGVGPKEQIEVKVAIRRLQELIPNDLKGATLEREWRRERGMETVSEMSQEAILGMKVVTLHGQKYLVRN